MFCERCGHKLQEGERFCSACGNRVEDMDSPKNPQDHMAGMGYGYKKEPSAGKSQPERNSYQRQTPKPDRRPERNTGRDHKKKNPDAEWAKEDRKDIITFAVLGVIIVALVIAIVVGVVKLVKSNDGKENRRVPQLTEEQKEELNHGNNNAQDSGIGFTEEPTREPEQESVEEAAAEEPEEQALAEDANVTPVPTQEVTPVPTQEPIEEEEEEDFVIPDSSTRYLKNEDLVSLSEWEVRVARNEIYARHGRMFTSKELKEYFEDKDWYEGTIAPEMFDNAYLNTIEIENLKFITNYEKAHNLNQ